MRLDFHTHGKLAKKLPFSTAYTDWLFSEARRAGLDALCLTEHFNTLQFDELYGYLSAISRRTEDVLELPNGLRIFPGMETDVAEGGHILSIGPLEAVLELNRRLEPYKQKGQFLPFAQLMRLFEEYPVLVGCGHPFRSPGHVPELPGRAAAPSWFFGSQRKGPGSGPGTHGRADLCLGTAAEYPRCLRQRHPPGSTVRLCHHSV